MVIVGAILDLLGTIWILQGWTVLPGSFMTGQPFWAGATLMVDGGSGMRSTIDFDFGSGT